MKYLVTGHRGFIGSYLMPRLPAVGVDLVDGNDILDCPLPDADIVIHLAAESGVIRSMRDPLRTMLVNVQGTARLVEHYQNAVFVFASSGGAIQETVASPYGLSKRMGEEYVRLRHPDYRILRFGNVYGPGSRSVIDRFLNGPVVVYGDGTATRTYVHISDLIRGIIASLDWPVGMYLFGGGQHYTVQEIADAVGKPVRYEDWRAGELRYSRLEKWAPRWEATVDALDYIRESVQAVKFPVAIAT